MSKTINTPLEVEVVKSSTLSNIVSGNSKETVNLSTALSKIAKWYDYLGGSATVDSTWVTGSTNPVESQLIQNTKPGLINTSTHGEAFGNNVTGNATGSYSHIEGSGTQASGENSHAEGMSTVAGGAEGHTEGYLSHADGEDSHAEGWHAYATGKASHAQNFYTIAASESQTALGKYNVEDSDDTYAVIIGNGSGDNARSNATTITWDGTIDTSGSLYVRGNDIFMGSDASGGLTYYPNGPSSTITDPAMGVKVMPDVDYENGNAFGLMSVILRGAGNTFLKNPDIRAMIRKGTTSVEGQTGIQLGNTTPAGTAGNRSGSVRLYTKGDAVTSSGGTTKPYVHIDPPSLSGVHGNYTVTLPSTAGTIALVSDIDTSAQSLTTSLTTLINSTDTTNRTWTTNQIDAADTAAQGYANSAKTDAKAYTDSEIDTLEGEYGTTWNDNSDWASAPWYPIATIDVTTAYTNVTLALHIQRGNGVSQKSVGTLVVTARVNESFTNITSFNSAWINVEDGLLSDDTYYKVRATCVKYDNKATFAVWLKLSTRYDSFSYRKIRGAYRNSKSDNGFDPDCWVINSWKNVNGYSLYHSGDDVIQCVPSFGETVKSSLSFMYNDTSSYEQGTASNPVYVNHGSVKLSTDDVSGTHTDYTIKLPKKNGTMALLSDIPSIPPIPTDYVPLGGTSSNAPVTGKIEFTGSSSYLLFDTNNTGIRFVDSSSDEFSGVAWNGANFWVGARAGSQPTHAGKTYISTGWDTTNSVGYNTIALSIPRAKDGSTTAVTRYVIHTGDNTFNAEDTLDEVKEIKLNNSSYSKDIRFRATNSHSDLWFGTFGSSNDGGGIYNITGGGFVMKSSTASGSLVNTFYGNASTADSAGAVTVTDITDTTSEKTYRVTQSPTTTGTGRNQYSSAGLQVVTRHNYFTRLEMGNTSENAVLRLYGSGAYYTDISAGAQTANRTITFPNKTGTVALTSDIQTSAVTNSTVSTSGSGNAITGLSISSGQLVATKGSTFLTSSDVGTAASKSYTTSVTSGSSSLVTSGAVYSAMTGWSKLSVSTASSPGIAGCSVHANASLVNPSLHLVFIDVLFAFNQNVPAGTSSKTVTAAITSTYRPDAHVTLPFSNGISVNGNAIMHTGGYIQLNIFTAITASSSSVKNIRVAGMYAYS